MADKEQSDKFELIEADELSVSTLSLGSLAVKDLAQMDKIVDAVNQANSVFSSEIKGVNNAIHKVLNELKNNTSKGLLNTNKEQARSGNRGKKGTKKHTNTPKEPPKAHKRAITTPKGDAEAIPTPAKPIEPQAEITQLAPAKRRQKTPSEPASAATKPTPASTLEKNAVPPETDFSQFSVDAGGRVRDETGKYANKHQSDKFKTTDGYQQAQQNRPVKQTAESPASTATGKGNTPEQDPQGKPQNLAKMFATSLGTFITKNPVFKAATGNADGSTADNIGRAVGGSYWVAAQEVASMAGNMKEGLSNRGIDSVGGAVDYAKNKVSDAKSSVSKRAAKLTKGTFIAAGKSAKALEQSVKNQKTYHQAEMKELKDGKNIRVDASRTLTDRALDMVGGEGRQGGDKKGRSSGKSGPGGKGRIGRGFSRVASSLSSMGSGIFGSAGAKAALAVGGVAAGAGAINAMDPGPQSVSDGANKKAVTKTVGSAAETSAEKGAAKAAQSGAVKAGATGVAKLGARAIPVIGTAAMAAYDAYSGFTDKEAQQRTFGLKDGAEASTGQKASMAIGNLLNMGGLVSGASGLIGSGLEAVGVKGASKTMEFDAGDIAKSIYSFFGGDDDKQKAQEQTRQEKVKAVRESTESQKELAESVKPAQKEKVMATNALSPMPAFPINSNRQFSSVDIQQVRERNRLKQGSINGLPSESQAVLSDPRMLKLLQNIEKALKNPSARAAPSSGGMGARPTSQGARNPPGSTAIKLDFSSPAMQDLSNDLG